MTKTPTQLLVLAAVFALLQWGTAFAQDSSSGSAPALTPAPAPATETSVKGSFDQALQQEGNWYFSWGYSRQFYAPSDIHISQPSLGNDFTVHQAKASDFASSPQDTFKSLLELDFTNPQENVRIGKFMNPEKTFAIEFSLDHSKYNVDPGQSVDVSGTINNAPASSPRTLDAQNFNYALHNGLNHLMVNAVWLKHLRGPENQAGQLQLISRAGAGILLPHADNTILGNPNEVGPKNENVCCFSKNDWWQINGWTAGVEVGLRYRVYKAIYLELTSKVAYGVLRGVPVYKGSADQTIWMWEQVLSTGFLF
jgi:hypothetical protein